MLNMMLGQFKSAVTVVGGTKFTVVNEGDHLEVFMEMKHARLGYVSIPGNEYDDVDHMLYCFPELEGATEWTVNP